MMDQDQANKLVAALDAAYPNPECPACADPLGESGHAPGCPGTSHDEESASVFAQLDFTGHDGRECGDHRSTGPRAWCHDCSEWCYRDSPCKGCELPQLRAENERLTKQVAALIHDRHCAENGPDLLKRAVEGLLARLRDGAFTAYDLDLAEQIVAFDAVRGHRSEAQRVADLVAPGDGATDCY